VDENLLNSFSALFAQMNTVVSLKELMKYKKDLRKYIGMMNAGPISKILPTF